MKVIGLCGGSGSGKGFVSKIFLEYGIPSIDTDVVYRELTSQMTPCLRALVEEFGDDIVTAEGLLDRRRLSQLVFIGDGSEKRLQKLNEISHKFILDETRKRLSEYEKAGFTAAIVDAPVLFESGFDKECDAIVAVLAKREIRIARIIARDGISKETADLRINSQIDDDKLTTLCDYVITNNGDIDSLRISVGKVAGLILEK